MDRERWQRIRALFDELVEMEPGERARRLAALGRDDAELRASVEQLLAADSDASARLGPRESPFVPPPFASDPLGLSGRTLSHFRVLGPLDAGGMGMVYRAEDTRLGRPVALKFILPQLSLDSSAKQRFLREARSAGALDHPNLCTIFEVGESEDGALFLAMPLYPGETLKSRLEREGALPIADALEIARQIAAGLACAHEAGIVHRDLKPGNVMLLPGGAVKILDFGLAKARDASLTATNATLGTVAYMAPEQVRGSEVDERVDLWALGVVLYEMLSGRRPFGAGNDLSTVHAILHEEPPPLGEIDGAGDEVRDALLRLLRKDPAERVASAAELRAALAHPGSGPLDLEHGEHVAGWPRRGLRIRPPAGLLAAPALLAMLAVAVYLAWSPAPSGEPDSAALAPLEIAVLPFEARDAGASAGVNDRLVDLLRVSFDSLGRLRAVQPDGLVEELGVNPRYAVARDRAPAIARREGLAFYVLGSTAEARGQLSIAATVYDRRGGVQVRSSRSGPSDRSEELIQRVSADLVAGLLPAAGVPSGYLRPEAAAVSRTPAAIRAYVEGVGWFRRWEHEKARIAFEAAIASDSTFALPYLALTRLDAATPRDVAGEDYLTTALRHSRTLPMRERNLVVAHHTFWKGADAATAEGLMRAVIAEDPDNFDAQELFASQILFHDGFRRGRSIEELRHALARLRELDPGYYAAVRKLRWLSETDDRRDSTAMYAREALRLLPNGHADRVYNEFVAALIEGTPEGRRRLMEEASKDPNPVSRFFLTWPAIRHSATYAEARELVAGTLETLPPELRTRAHIQLAGRALSEGKRADAEREKALAAEQSPLSAILLELIPAPGSDSLRLRHARERLGALTSPEDVTSDGHLRTLYLRGLLGVRTGSAAEVDAALQGLRRSGAAAPPGSRASSYAHDLQLTIRGYAAWLAGENEQALDLLSRQRLSAWWHPISANSLWLGASFERFLRAEVLFALGGEHDREAASWYRALGSVPDELVFWLPKNLRLARIHERQGELAEARRRYALVADRLKECDPEFRPLLAEARAGLARVVARGA